MHSLLRGNALLALAAAALWGGGDFAGGMGVSSARGGLRVALRVVLLGHITSLAVLAAIACARGDVFPQGALLAWGIAAGVAGGVALTCFYLALSRGAMGVSAAVSGLLAAAIPAMVDMWQEGSPGAWPLAGFAVAGVAIWLIAAGPVEENGPHSRDEAARMGHPAGASRRGTLALAMVAGVGFGVYLVALKMAGPAGVVWPMATARIGSLSICGLMFAGVELRERKAAARLRLGCKTLAWALGAGLLDTSGNLLFIASTRAGRLDVAAVLASLYPAGTILLAALVLGERPKLRQALGMAAAVAAVVMIAV